MPHGLDLSKHLQCLHVLFKCNQNGYKYRKALNLQYMCVTTHSWGHKWWHWCNVCKSQLSSTCCPLKKKKKATVFSRIASDGVKLSISWELLTPPFSGGCPQTVQTTTCKAAALHRCFALFSANQQKKNLKFFPPPHLPVQVCLGQLTHLAHMVMQTPVPVQEARTSRQQGQGEQPAPFWWQC